jgi:hypothetical protein
LFYFCSADTADALAAQNTRLLSRLAELSLAVAEDVHTAVLACDDTDQMVRLADSFVRVGRCMRMSIALSMRLARGEPLSAPREEVLETEAAERDESRFIEERPERLDDRENLFDRLPSGDLNTQIATVARSLASAARSLPAPAARDYRKRCEALATTSHLPHWEDRPTKGGQAAVLEVSTRPRGPPRRLN